MIYGTSSIKRNGIYDSVLKILKKEDKNVVEIANVMPNPTIDKLYEGIQIARNHKADLLLAVGGGSVIDTAKGVRMLLSQNKEDINELMGNEILNYGKHIPFIVVPTTSGTGSEVTIVAVIEDKIKNLKMEFISYFLLPDVAVLDPEMTMTLPKKATASTGIDALCHAIEAYTCIQKNPLSDAYAISAIKIIMDNIEIAVKNGENKKARLSMANASLMAGISFSNSMVGLVHAIGHSIGAVSKVPHGDAISILLPYVMEYNFDVVKEEYAKIALYTIPEECINKSEEERAVLLIGKVKSLIKKLNEETGLPKRLKDVKINKNDFEKIAQTSINDGAIIVNSKKADIIDIINILEKAY